MKIIALAACAISVLCQQQAPAPTANTIHDALLDVTTVELSGNNSLSVEPGVRASVKDDVLTLSTYDGSAFELMTGTSRIQLLSPAVAKVTADGIVINGVTHPKTSAFVARRRVQDDTDANLETMKKSADRLKAKNLANQNNQNNQKNKNNGLPKTFRFAFQENFMPSSLGASQVYIQSTLHQFSPIGF